MKLLRAQIDVCGDINLLGTSIDVCNDIKHTGTYIHIRDDSNLLNIPELVRCDANKLLDELHGCPRYYYTTIPSYFGHDCDCFKLHNDLSEILLSPE